MNTRQEKTDWLIDNLYTIPVGENPRKTYEKMSDDDLDTCIRISKKDLENSLTRDELQEFLNIISKYNTGSILIVEHPEDEPCPAF